MIISCTSTSANSDVGAAEREAREGIGRQRAEHELAGEDQRHQQEGVEEVARERRGGPARRGSSPASAARAGRSASSRRVEGRPDRIGSGATHKIASSQAPMVVQTRAAGAWGARSSVVHRLVEIAELEQRDQRQHRQQNHGERGGVAVSQN
jgi:hypothetical protein